MSESTQFYVRARREGGVDYRLLTPDGTLTKLRDRALRLSRDTLCEVINGLRINHPGLRFEARPINHKPRRKS
jgi:hypothetical protein